MVSTGPKDSKIGCKTCELVLVGILPTPFGRLVQSQHPTLLLT